MMHIYKNNEGIDIPSVTTVINTILHKPGIAEWSNTLGLHGKKYLEVLNEKANIGTYVHNAIERYLKGEDYKPIMFPALDKEVKIYLTSFISFLNSHEIKNPIMEKTYVCEKYGGTVDLICELDGKMVLCDFKTSKSFYISHFIQLSAYLALICKNDEDLYNKIENCYIIRVNKDKTVLHKLENRELYLKIFKSILDIYYNLEFIKKGND